MDTNIDLDDTDSFKNSLKVKPNKKSRKSKKNNIISLNFDN